MFQRRVSATNRKTSPSAPELLEARFRRFLRDFQSYEQHLEFQSTMDSFLDLYSSWKRNGDELTKLRLVMLAFELHRLDSAFQCDLSFDGSRGGEASCETSLSET